MIPGRMQCWNCETPMIWGSDFDNDEDYYGHGEGEFGIFSCFTCPKCRSEAIFFHYTGEEDEEEGSS